MDKILLSIKGLLVTAIATPWSPLSDIKKVYYGDPIVVPECDMPAIIVHPENTDITMTWSRYDKKNHAISVKLIYNLKAFLGGSDPSKITAVQDSIKKIEDSNENHEIMSNTITWIIQKNVSLPYDNNWTTRHAAELARVTSIAYPFTQNRGFPAYEVIVSVEAIAIGNR